MIMNRIQARQSRARVAGLDEKKISQHQSQREGKKKAKGSRIPSLIMVITHLRTPLGRLRFRRRIIHIVPAKAPILEGMQETEPMSGLVRGDASRVEALC
jgi:hypothetical protein